MSIDPPCEHATTHSVIIGNTERSYCDACGVMIASHLSDEALRVLRWEKWRRWLRRNGLPVPDFMLPEKK